MPACGNWPTISAASLTASRSWPGQHVGHSWAGYPAGSLAIDFDEDLAVYARTDLQGNCDVRRVADDHLLHHFSGPGPGTPIGWMGSAPYFSPDGRFLAIRINI